MSDNNIKAQTPENNKPDPLGYDVYARTLWTRIQAALNKDAGDKPLKDDPLVVGIFGEWGAGKSHLLQLMYELSLENARNLAETRETDKTLSLTVPVFFQPWKYEHEQHLHVPLLLHIHEALKKQLQQAQTAGEQLTEDLDNAFEFIKGHAQGAVSLFDKGLKGAIAVLDLPATGGTATAAIGVAGWLGKWLGDKSKKSAETPDPIKGLKYSDTGRYFYEIHDLLRAATRPKKYGATQGLHLAYDIRVNFVIFIDDLDRCLPEKAVQTLELIKTVFNVESFAFVLALDDEVIERGIGHRYKEYKLQDKKPEMPITGFEYLEKIVHLPFRLPALTRNDAIEFLQLKERELRETLPNDSELLLLPAWFGELDAHHAGQNKSSEKSDVPDYKLHLGSLVVSCFEAYVPRKLVRVVELYYQVLKIAHQRGRPIRPELGDQRDPRIVLAFVMLQLFQPELYRTLKRTGSGFDVLFDAVKSGNINSDSSDIDLIRWACFDKGAAIDLKTAIQEIGENPEQTERGPAQRKRLPIVERLLEHREVERHAFDPLKLFEALTLNQASYSEQLTRSYYSLLSKEAPSDTEYQQLRIVRTIHNLQGTNVVSQSTSTSGAVHIVESGEDRASGSGTIGPQDKRERVSVSNIPMIFRFLISAEESERKEAIALLNFNSGQALSQQSAFELHRLLDDWLTPKESNETTSVIDGRKRQFLRSLELLAPHIASDDGNVFWNLVKDIPGAIPPTEPNTPTPNPSLTSLYMDIQSMLGQDKRFNAGRYYLMTSDKSAKDGADFMANFVRIKGGKYTAGHKSVSDNQPSTVDAGPTFYMARSLTTVDQYRAFMEDGGYTNKDYWDHQGWELLQDERFAYTRNTRLPWESIPERISPEPVFEPTNWTTQKNIGSRPVWGVTWFEARAYARWLDAKLVDELRILPLPANYKGTERYSVCLPTESQWEFAVRADDTGKTHQYLWPWGDDSSHIHLLANIRGSGIEHSSVPGCFSPNTNGLWDMAGNLWEWQDGLYDLSSSNPINNESQVHIQNYSYQRLPKGRSATAWRNWISANLISLRGGSSVHGPETVACAFRTGHQASDSVSCFGFRVMLSLG